MYKNNQQSAENHITVVMMTSMIAGPLLWAANQSLTILLLQLLSLYAFGWIMLGTDYIHRMHRHQSILLLVLFASLTIFLLPLPYDLWAVLPGHYRYDEVIQGISTSIGVQWRAASMAPAETERALWLLLPPVATYIAVIGLPDTHVRRLIHVAIAVAVFQSFLGLIQYGGGVALFNIVDGRYQDMATGTYLNRDHLAGFLEMVFPVLLALMAAKIGHHSRHRGAARMRWRFLASLEGNQSLLYGIAAILVILCIVFTRSRTGIVLTMAGLLLVLLAFSRRLGKVNTYGSYGTLIAVIVILSIEIGLAPILDRFSVDFMQDLRWELYSTTMYGIAEFFPLGSGPGTYSSVYPVFQIPHNDFFINHAHNDYLEWVFEAGLMALVIILATSYLYFKNWGVIWIKGQWDTSRYIQVGAGIGVLLMMLHSFVDFNLHKPVNAIYFAFFLAVFMRPPQQVRNE